MQVVPVILCGGAGTRLWPASTPQRPKQFLALVGARSLFQETLLRVTPSQGRRPLVVAGEDHLALIQAQVAELGLDCEILVEPMGRDSGPAIAAAATRVAQGDPDALMLVVASDHHIPDAGQFNAAVAEALPAARQGFIITFGIQPREPSTAYGYLEPGQALGDGSGVRRLAKFVEKPDVVRAEDYLRRGFLWNSGNFLARAGSFLDELQAHAPALKAAAEAAVGEGVSTAGVLRLGAAFCAAPKISIDFAVMERTDRAAVLPLPIAWSDLGAWDAIWTASDRDEAGNAITGHALAVDTERSLIRSSAGISVLALGLSDVAIIAEPGGVLVCALGSAQAVKDTAAALKRGKPSEPVGAPTLTAAWAQLSPWLYVQALPLWWALGADHEKGGFHEALDVSAMALDVPRRLRVQARQIVVYASAAQLGWRGPARAAVEHGLAFLRSRYRRADGLYRTLVAAGTALDDTAVLYDQAFVMLALARSASLVGRRGEHAAEAEAILRELRSTRRAPGGGYIEADPERPFQSNPHMHLLEAALAWVEVAPDGPWRGLADELAGLALSHFIDPQSGALREFFDTSWRPAAGLAGRRVEPGHQFEWAWLIERWARLSDRADASAAAARLYAIGHSFGLNAQTGAAIDALLDDFQPHETSARLWPQPSGSRRR